MGRFLNKLYLMLTLASLILTLCHINVWAATDPLFDIKVIDYVFDTKNPGIIKGSFVLDNKTDTVFPELWYCTDLKILFSEKDENYLSCSPKQLTLKRLEPKLVQFSLPIPQNLPLCDYSLTVTVYTRNGKIIDTQEKSLGKLGEGNNYLKINYDKMVFLNAENGTGTFQGTNFPMDTSPRIKVPIVNQGEQVVNVNPFVNIYRRGNVFESKPISSYKITEVFELKPGVDKEIIISLPTFKVPDLYYATISFSDVTGNTFAGIAEANYTIEGPSAKIMQTVANVQKGVLSTITEITQSGDMKELTDANLSVQVLDQDGKTVFQSQKKITILDIAQRVQLDGPLSLEKGTLTFLYSLEYKGKELDTFKSTYSLEDMINKNPVNPSPQATANLGTKNTSNSTSTNTKSSNSNTAMILIIVILLICLLGAGYYFLRLKNKNRS